MFWVGWILISLMNPFGLYTVSDKAYFLLWMNIFFFSLGFILFSKQNSPKTYYAIHLSNNQKYALVILQIIVLLTIAYYYLQYNHMFADMTIHDARRIKFELGLLFKSYTEYAIYTYFITSLLYMSLVINVGRYILNSKVDMSIVITLISAVLFGLTGMGRFIFFNTIVFFIIAIAFKKKHSLQENNSKLFKQAKYNKTKYFLICIAGIAYMAVLTGRRMGQTISGGKQFLEVFMISVEQGITYFIGPFRAFDNFLTFKISESIGHTYGRSTFGGIDEMFNNLAILIGAQFTSANAKMASFTVDSIFIGQHHTFNAFYTGVMNFYLDGGVGGVVILAFLYGALAAVVWNHYQKYPQLFSYSLLIYFTHTTIASEYRLAFSAPSTWIILVSLIISSRWYHKKTVQEVHALDKQYIKPKEITNGHPMAN